MDEMDAARLVAVGAACLAGIVLGTLATGLLLAVAHLRGRIKSSRGWRPTQGTITAAGSRRHSPSRGSTYYYPVVTYAFEAAGRRYTHDRIAFGVGPSSSHDTPESAAARYPVGSQVTVYVNPRNPADAVLERRETNWTLYAMAGIVFVVAAVVPIAMVFAAFAAMEGG
jgi:hypothetical protein